MLGMGIEKCFEKQLYVITTWISLRTTWVPPSHIFPQNTPKPLVKWKGRLTGQWKGPDILTTSGRGYVCVSPWDARSSLWIPDRLIIPYGQPAASLHPTLQLSVQEVLLRSPDTDCSSRILTAFRPSRSPCE